MDQKHLLSTNQNLYFDYSIWKHRPLSREVVFAKPTEGSLISAPKTKPNQNKQKQKQNPIQVLIP